MIIVITIIIIIISVSSQNGSQIFWYFYKALVGTDVILRGSRHRTTATVVDRGKVDMRIGAVVDNFC